MDFEIFGKTETYLYLLNTFLWSRECKRSEASVLHSLLGVYGFSGINSATVVQYHHIKQMMKESMRLNQ